MRFQSLVVAAFLTLQISVASAQEAPRAEAQRDTTTFDASAAFAFFTGQASAGFLLPGIFETGWRMAVEAWVASYHLILEQRWEPPLASGGVWRGDNETGQLRVFISSEEGFSKTHSVARITYLPSSEQPMPDAMLTHLLSQAERTEIDSATTVSLAFPFEQTANGRCSSRRTLVVRMTTGAMVGNAVTTRCENEPGAP